MAHFAELNENNQVIRVLVTDNDMVNEGYDWLINNFGGTWVQTSYSGSIRKNFAGIGYTYDADRDAFIAPQPYPSWLLNEETCKWEAPVPYPEDDRLYSWSEDTQSWDLVEF